MYSILMDILIGIITLGFLILIHELGHLLVAKWSGVAVYEFAVGMGPKIFGKKYKDTTYNLRVLPVGGYVKLAGLDFEEQNVPEEDKFQNKPWIARFATLAAGSSMNILFGFIVFYFIFFFSGTAKLTNKIESVVAGSPAAMAGLLAGDKLFSVADKEIGQSGNKVINFIHSHNSETPIKIVIDRESSITTNENQSSSIVRKTFFAKLTNKIESVVAGSPAAMAGLLAGDKLFSVADKEIGQSGNKVINFIHSHNSETPIKIVIDRESSITTNENQSSSIVRKTFFVTPEYNEALSRSLIGIEIEQHIKKFNPLTSFASSIRATVSTLDIMKKSLQMLFSGQASLKDMSGPIGMIQITSYQAKESAILFFQFVAIISIALGFMNLLPIPVLDGGHIVFLIIEGILKKPVPQRIQLMINNIFAICLITFMIFIIINDIRFWSDRSDFLNELN